MHLMRSFAVGVIFFGGIFCLWPTISLAVFNQQINYQGKLTNTAGSAVSNGDYVMKFRLYTAATSATTTNIWEEIRTASGDKATVTDGLFSVMLGSSTALTSVNFNQTLYLGVEVCGTSDVSGCDGEMTPRKILGATPAAFEALKLDGIATSSFLRGDAGNVGIGTTSPYARLSVHATSGLYANTLFAIASSTASATSTHFVVNANGNVGIGTTSPYAALSVVGASGVVANIFTATSTTATSTFAGVLGIGTTSPFSSPLFVVGTSSPALFVSKVNSNVGVHTNNTTLVWTGSTYGPHLTVKNDFVGSALGLINLRLEAYGSFNYLVPTSALGSQAVPTTLVGGETVFSISPLGYDGTDYEQLATLKFEVDDTGGATVGANDMPGRIVFSTSPDGTGSSLERMLIDNKGRIGINTGGSPDLLSMVNINSTTSNSAGYGLRVQDVDDGNLFVVRNDGIVMIGTSSPGVATSEDRLVIYDLFEPVVEFASNFGGTNLSWTAGLDVNTTDTTGKYRISASADLDQNTIFSIDSTGNVGIGTTSPYARSAVHAFANSTYRDTLFAIASSTNSATSTHFNVLASGNVGIGTTSPYAALSVVGASGVVANIFTATSTTVTSNIAGALTVGGVGTFNGSSVSFSNGGETLAITPNSPSNYVRLSASPTSNLELESGGDIDLDIYSGGAGAAAVRFKAGGTELGTFNDLGYMTAVRLLASTGGETLTIIPNSPTNYVKITTNPTSNLEMESGGDIDLDMLVAGSVLRFQAAGNTVGVIDGTGRFGLGTTSPYAKSAVHAFANSTYLDILFAIASSTGAATSTHFNVMASGNVGIGTTSPWRTMSVSGTVGLSTNLTAAAGTPGTLCYDTTTFEMTRNAAANCTVSSRDYKEKIEPLGSSLDSLLALEPAQFAYKDKPDRLRWGFIAEQLAEVDLKLGDAYDEDGHARSIDLAAISSITVKGVQELYRSLQNLTGQTITYVTATFEKLIAKEIKTDKLCLGATCINETELKQLMNQGGVVVQPIVIPDPTPVVELVPPPASTTTPILEPEPVIIPEPPAPELIPEPPPEPAAE